MTSIVFVQVPVVSIILYILFQLLQRLTERRVRLEIGPLISFIFHSPFLEHLLSLFESSCRFSSDLRAQNTCRWVFGVGLVELILYLFNSKFPSSTSAPRLNTPGDSCASSSPPPALSFVDEDEVVEWSGDDYEDLESQQEQQQALGKFGKAPTNLDDIYWGLPTLTVSENGRCGGRSGFTCEGSRFGQCCSIYGWCGFR